MATEVFDISDLEEKELKELRENPFKGGRYAISKRQIIKNKVK